MRPAQRTCIHEWGRGFGHYDSVTSRAL